VRHEHGRHTLAGVWRDCAINGRYARQVRLRHKVSLRTPFFLRHRILTLALAPAIAAAVTARIITRRKAVMFDHAATWPAIYLTKIAWCWGASRS
jgi:hypothetical protein